MRGLSSVKKAAYESCMSYYTSCLAAKAALEARVCLLQGVCPRLEKFEAKLQGEEQADAIAKAVVEALSSMLKAPPDCELLRIGGCRYLIGRIVETSRLANLFCAFCRRAEQCELCRKLLELWHALSSASASIWQPEEKELIRVEHVGFAKIGYLKLGGKVYAVFQRKARSYLQAEALKSCLRVLFEKPPNGHGIGEAIESGMQTIREELCRLAGYNWFNEVALEAVMRYFRLHELYPLIANPRVTEVYGTLGHELYFDHIPLGRCDSRIQLTSELYDRILSIAELDPHSWLDERSPSLKTSVETRYFKLRITVDGAPLAEPSVDIRNLTSIQLLSLPTLVSIGTISYIDAAKLLRAMVSGASVLVAGPTGSGKTTLCNALLVFVSPSARIVSVEDSREIEDMNRYGKKHHMYVVPPIESGDREGKWEEVLKLLHRNPDVVFLGELQHQMHVEAFFTAVESGFQVIATTHARSLRELREKWTRWRSQFDPHKVDVVVIMEKNSGTRRVAAVKQGGGLRAENRAHIVEKLLQVLEKGEIPNTECAKIVNEAYHGVGA